MQCCRIINGIENENGTIIGLKALHFRLNLSNIQGYPLVSFGLHMNTLLN